MEWIALDKEEAIDEIREQSKDCAVMIFKHSTSCSISSMALGRMERSWSVEEMSCVKPYYLDILRHRQLSNKIAETFGVSHESPQVLIIRDGKSIYDNSHMAISYQEIKKQAIN